MLPAELSQKVTTMNDVMIRKATNKCGELESWQYKSAIVTLGRCVGKEPLNCKYYK